MYEKTKSGGEKRIWFSSIPVIFAVVFLFHIPQFINMLSEGKDCPFDRTERKKGDLLLIFCGEKADINSADPDELQKILRAILKDKNKAEKITNYIKNTKVNSIDELVEIQGIGKRTVEKIERFFFAGE